MILLNNTQNAYPPFLNPGEPFAYLPPNAARQLRNLQYVACATTGMFAWELFLDLPSMYKLCIASRPQLPGVVYLISRIGTLLWNTFALQFLIAGGDCRSLYIGLGSSWVFGSIGTSMLFFLRVRALYRDNVVVTRFFTFLWLCIVGGALTVPIADGTFVSHLVPNESFCISYATLPGYEGSAIVIPAIYDTLVFLAVSYRLFPAYDVDQDTTWKTRGRLFLTGQGRLSKALLQSGQQYYTMSVAVNVFALAFYFTPSTPQPYRIMVSLILLDVINSMACKVYRDIKLGHISQSVTISMVNERSTSDGHTPHTAPRSQGDAIVDVDVAVSPSDNSLSRSVSTNELVAEGLVANCELEGDRRV